MGLPTATSRQIKYRARQFFTALRPTVTEADAQLVRTVFADTPAALPVFERMSLADQQHAIAVLRTLLNRDQDHPALQQAALLHDVGKSLGQPLIYRVAIVILKRFWPHGLLKLSAGPLAEAGWRQPFVIHHQHPQIGARWARDAGCLPLAVSLIETHQNCPQQQPESLEAYLHRALYLADGEH